MRAAAGRRPLLLVLLLVGLLAALPARALAEATNSGDDLRDGWYHEQTTLNPSLVSGGSFGQLWAASLEGSVYAQPLLANGTLLVATENNDVYGLNPSTGAQNWKLNLGTPWHSGDIGCGDLAPNIGVTATPVIDTATNTAYMTHKTYVSGTSGPAKWYMDAIDLSKGTEKAGFPVLLSGSAQNAPGQTFQPTTELSRPGLLLMNGVVYTAFGSDCDHTPWQGWVFGVSEAGAVTARWTSRPSGNGAGIWQSGAGITSDGPGTLLVSTGNDGAPSTPTAGHTPPASLGESIIRLAVQSDGSLKAVDFFAPFDADQLDTWDADFASGGITGLNEQFFGTPSTPKLAVAVGKDGYVYLLNRANLGGFAQGPSGSDAVVQRLGPYGGVWSRPGVWPGEGGWVYIPTASGGNTAGGTSGFLRVYQYGVSGSGEPTLSLQATSSDAFGFGSGAPVITSEGTASGSALVWVEWMPNGGGTGAQLRAYDPIPVSGKPVLRYSAPIGTASKFATPGVGANRLYVGNREGKVMAFGSPITAPLTGPTTSFPTVTIGSSAEKTLTLTANESLTVNKITTNSPQFTAAAPTPALPASLGSGQAIQIPLTFKPTQTGLIGASVSVETSAGTLQFALSGTGRAAEAQLEASPTVLSFGGVEVGGHSSSAATFRNVGGAPLTINAVKLPAAPFGATGVPESGTTIAAGGSLTINVTFDPTAEGNYEGELGLETSAGNAAIGISGSAGSPGNLQITGEKVEYGSVTAGSASTKSFTLTNTGGTAVTITKSKPPSGGAFAATTSLPEGSTVQPGESLIESVTFTPGAPGYASATWPINGNDLSGLHEVQFSGTGAVPAPGAAWSHNGSATISSAGVVQTTPAATNQAGSSFFTTPLESSHLVVQFDQTIGSGTGADGQALLFADASKATTASLGEHGGGLGFSGIPGIAVAFDTYKNSANPSNNFVGVSNGPGSAKDLLHWLATATSIPALRGTVRHIKVEALNGTVSVWIEGAKVLSTAVTLPPKVLLGFSGGTGGLTDIHQAANVVIGGNEPPGEPQPATLKLTTAVNAPSGSPQAGAQFAISGNCPSSFTTAALGNGGSATPTLTGAVAGAGCSVSQAAPTESGWKTTASVNGGPAVELSSSGGQLAVPSFALAAGVNTIALTNTYTPPPAASLKLTVAVNAPSGSPQAGAQFAISGNCPSSFTTAALGNGGSATPTLTGAVAGAGCSVSQAAPGENGWKTTASVNGGPAVELSSSGGQLAVPSFALAAGVNTIALTDTYTPPTASLIPDPSEGGWQLNGSAALEGTSLVLTPVALNEAGSAFWPKAMNPANLSIEFESSIGGGTGADGLALVIADAGKGATPTSLGQKGGGLGFGGIPGLAVALDTFKNSANPSSNFVGVSNGVGSGEGLLHWLGTANVSASLRTTHKIKITTSGGAFTAYIDGTKIGSLSVTLPASAYIGFSGGTGEHDDRHAIAKLAVTSTG